jgi:C2 domain
MWKARSRNVENPLLAHLTVMKSFDSGDTDWINGIVEQLWPYISQALVTSSREFLEHAIRENMPRYLPSVIFTTLDLGSVAPVVTAISVRCDKRDKLDNPAANSAKGRSKDAWSSRSRAKNAGSTIDMPTANLLAVSTTNEPDPPDCVVIELSVEYSGYPNVEMALEYSPTTCFGIDSAELKGRVELVIAPIINRLPMFAAFQAAFINPPEVDFTLTGLAVAGDMGPWTRKFRDVVHMAVGAVAVLPNRVALSLDSSVDFFDMCRAVSPSAVLRVAVVKGQGFPHTDENAIKQSLGQSAQPDVYVVLSLGAISQRTRRVDNNDRPVFDHEVFDFILSTISPSQMLSVEAFDFDIDSQDDELGRAKISVRSLLEHPETVVRLKHSPMGAIPTVTLAARLLNLSSNLSDVFVAFKSHRSGTFRPQHCSPLVLSVSIDKASNLPAGGTIRPFVKVLLGDKEIMRTWNAIQVEGLTCTETPEWQFSRQVLINCDVQASTRLAFEVRDAASNNGIGGETELLGFAHLQLADLVRRNPCRQTYNFALCNAMLPRASLRVRVGLDAVLPEPAPPLWDLYRRQPDPR